MAKHKVLVKLPAQEVVNSDVIFEIFGDESKLGELRISKGGLDYFPRDRKKSITITWEQFDKKMGEEL